jgi:hypothetical protein
METWPDVYDKDLVYRTMHINKINEKVPFGLDTIDILQKINRFVNIYIKITKINYLKSIIKIIFI